MGGKPKEGWEGEELGDAEEGEEDGVDSKHMYICLYVRSFSCSIESSIRNKSSAGRFFSGLRGAKPQILLSA